MQQKISANLIDLKTKSIYPAIVTLTNNKISSIEKTDEKYNTYILPGFIDAHVHIESSMLVPSEFARRNAPARIVVRLKRGVGNERPQTVLCAARS